MASHLVVSSASLQGHRGKNEDRVLARILPGEPDTAMVAVADGMGGHEAGEVAAELAIRGLSKLIKSRKLDHTSPEIAHKTIYSEINRRILRTARRLDRVGMGTTLVSVLLRGDQVAVAHVGDSRAYRLDHKEMVQLTEDHSVVQDAIRRGIVDRAEAGSVEYGHALTQAMGTDAEVTPGFLVENASLSQESGRVYLVCSDGLWGPLSDSSMEQIVRRTSTLEEAAGTLVNAALNAGSEDNISVALMEIGTFARSPVPLELPQPTDLEATVRYRPRSRPRRMKRVWGIAGMVVLASALCLIAWHYGSRSPRVVDERALARGVGGIPAVDSPPVRNTEGPRMLWVDVGDVPREILLPGSVSLGKAEPGQPLRISAYPGDTLRARPLPGLNGPEVVLVVTPDGPDTIRINPGLSASVEPGEPE